MNICYRNQQLLKDEKGFALFLTGHYKKSNARHKDYVNIVSFSKNDIEQVFSLEKLIKEIEAYGFEVFQDLKHVKDADLFLLYQTKDEIPIKDIKVIKRECLFF